MDVISQNNPALTFRYSIRAGARDSPEAVTFSPEAVTFFSHAVKFFSHAVKFSRGGLSEISRAHARWKGKKKKTPPMSPTPLLRLGATCAGWVGCFSLIPSIISAYARE